MVFVVLFFACPFDPPISFQLAGPQQEGRGGRQGPCLQGDSLRKILVPLGVQWVAKSIRKDR